MKRAKHAQNSKLTIQNSKLMKIQPADRLSLVQEYYFSRKLKEVAKLNAEGKDYIPCHRFARYAAIAADNRQAM